MKISTSSENPVGRLLTTFSAVCALAGAFWNPSAVAVTTTDNAVAGTPASTPIQVQPAPPLHSPGVQDICKMIDAKVDAEVVKAYIKNSPTAYFLSAQEIIDLKTKGVSDDVVTAMIQHGAEVRTRATQMAAPSPSMAPPQYPPADSSYAQAPGDAQAPYAQAPAYGSDYSDYGSPYYASYPYYSYYPYNYSYNYWWGYPWYGYAYWPYYYGYHGGYHYGHDHHGDDHHGHDYAHHNGQMNHGGSFNGSRSFGTAHGNQPWQPVGTSAGRSSSTSGRGAFSPVGGFSSRPASGFASRPTSFASSGFRSSPAGFSGGGNSAAFHGGGGGFRSGGGGHSMGGGGHR